MTPTPIETAIQADRAAAYRKAVTLSASGRSGVARKAQAERDRLMLEQLVDEVQGRGH